MEKKQLTPWLKDFLEKRGTFTDWSLKVTFPLPSIRRETLIFRLFWRTSKTKRFWIQTLFTYAWECVTVRATGSAKTKLKRASWRVRLKCRCITERLLSLRSTPDRSAGTSLEENLTLLSTPSLLCWNLAAAPLDFRKWSTVSSSSP